MPITQPSHLSTKPLGKTVPKSVGTDPRMETPPLWPYLLVCTVVAACIDLGHLHQGEHSDSIIPILVSLQRWTAFFWEQDRFGMLLPLLAAPFHHPLVNLLVQEWLETFAGLAPFFLVSRYILRDRFWPLAATLATAYLLVFVPAVVRFEWFAAQPYGTSLTLATAALLILEAKAGENWRLSRLPVALFFIMLANWVNCSISIVFIPLVVLRSLLGLGPPTAQFSRQQAAAVQSRIIEFIKRWTANAAVCSMGMLAFGAVWGRAMARLQKHVVTTSTNYLPLADWPGAWSKFAALLWKDVFPWPAFLILLIAPATGMILLLIVPTLRRHSRQMFAMAAALVGAGLLFWFLVGTLIHVKGNLYNPRYASPSLLFVAIVAATFAGAPFRALSLKALRFLLPVSAVILMGTAMYSYGFPSVRTVRKDIDEKMGGASKDILAAHANIIAGGYWRVWPAVFHANLILYEQGERNRIYGITFRALPTRKYWSRIPLGQMRAAVLAGDQEEAERELRAYGLPLTMVEHYTALDVFGYKPLSPTSTRLSPASTR